MRRFLGCLLVVWVFPAQAQQEPERGVYLGVSAGAFRYEETESVSGIEFSDTAPTYRVFGGYRFGYFFALEGGWEATGDLEDTIAAVDTALGELSVSIKADLRISTLRAIGILPLAAVQLYAGLGYYDSRVDATGTVIASELPGPGNIVVTDSEGDNGATAVVGLQHTFSRLAIRAQYEWFDTASNVDVSALGVGLLYQF